ncbi:unnamed protein product [Musa hybrid cultivar]
MPIHLLILDKSLMVFHFLCPAMLSLSLHVSNNLSASAEGLFSASLDKLSTNSNKQTQSVELTTYFLSLAKKLILEFVVGSVLAIYFGSFLI